LADLQEMCPVLTGSRQHPGIDGISWRIRRQKRLS